MTTRREFLKLAGVAVAGTLLSACGKKVNESSASTSTEAPKTDVPRMPDSTEYPIPEPVDKATPKPIPTIDEVEKAIETVVPTQQKATAEVPVPSVTPLPETVVGGAGGPYTETQTKILESEAYRAKRGKLLSWFNYWAMPNCSNRAFDIESVRISEKVVWDDFADSNEALPVLEALMDDGEWHMFTAPRADWERVVPVPVSEGTYAIGVGDGPLEVSAGDPKMERTLAAKDGRFVRLSKNGNLMEFVNKEGVWEDRWENIETVPATVEEVANLPEMASVYEDFDAYMADEKGYNERAMELAKLHPEKRLVSCVVMDGGSDWQTKTSMIVTWIRFGEKEDITPLAMARMKFNGQDGVVFTYAGLVVAGLRKAEDPKPTELDRDNFFLVHFYLQPEGLGDNLSKIENGKTPGIVYFPNTQNPASGVPTEFRDELFKIYEEKGLLIDLDGAIFPGESSEGKEYVSSGVIFPIQRVYGEGE